MPEQTALQQQVQPPPQPEDEGQAEGERHHADGGGDPRLFQGLGSARPAVLADGAADMLGVEGGKLAGADSLRMRVGIQDDHEAARTGHDARPELHGLVCSSRGSKVASSAVSRIARAMAAARVFADRRHAPDADSSPPSIVTGAVATSRRRRLLLLRPRTAAGSQQEQQEEDGHRAHAGATLRGLNSPPYGLTLPGVFWQVGE